MTDYRRSPIPPCQRVRSHRSAAAEQQRSPDEYDDDAISSAPRSGGARRRSCTYGRRPADLPEAVSRAISQKPPSAAARFTAVTPTAHPLAGTTTEGNHLAQDLPKRQDPTFSGSATPLQSTPAPLGGSPVRTSASGASQPPQPLLTPPTRPHIAS
jgi:hypothetical protein